MTLPSACPLCNADHTQVSPVTSHVFGSQSNHRAFYSCHNCEVIFQHPNLSEEELHNFYSAEFESFMNQRSDTADLWTNALDHSSANHHHFVRRLPFFNHLISPNSRVLEYGCSSGFMLYPLMDKGCEVHGIEPSGLFSEFSKSKGIKIHNDSADFQASYSNYFDLILHFFVFEHIVDPFQFLSTQLSLLSPGGSILFEVPSSSDALFRLFDIPEFERFYFSIAHPWYYNKTSLTYILEKLDLTYTLIPHQRYDFSNHFTWALKRSPGGMGKYSKLLSEEFELSYKQNLVRTGFCDTYFVEVIKP